MDVAKTADGQTVLAQVSWGHHQSIGCYLVLNDAAVSALRAATPPQSLPQGQTDASKQCSVHHKFGAEPVDVAKTADGQTVLARLSWGHHESIGCYLVLDPTAVLTLRAAKTQAPGVAHFTASLIGTGDDRTIVAKWSNPDSSGNPYRFEYKADYNRSYQGFDIFLDAGEEYEFELTDLAPGITYIFRTIRGSSSRNDSDWVKRSVYVAPDPTHGTRISTGESEVAGVDVPAGQWQYREHTSDSLCIVSLFYDGSNDGGTTWRSDRDRYIEIPGVGSTIRLQPDWHVYLHSNCGAFEYMAPGASPVQQTTMQGWHGYVAGVDVPAGQWQYREHTSDSLCIVSLFYDGSNDGGTTWRSDRDRYIEIPGVGSTIRLQPDWHVYLHSNCGTFEHRP